MQCLEWSCIVMPADDHLSMRQVNDSCLPAVKVLVYQNIIRSKVVEDLVLTFCALYESCHVSAENCPDFSTEMERMEGRVLRRTYVLYQ